MLAFILLERKTLALSDLSLLNTSESVL